MSYHSPSAVPRLRVHYHTYFAGHVMNLHFPTGTDAATAVSYGASVINQLKALMMTSEAFDAADYIPAGTNVGNPVAWTPIAGTMGAATPLPTTAAISLGFVGRTLLGTRARLFLFSTSTMPDANWRISTVESSVLATIIAWMNSLSCPLVALDNQAPVWKPMVTVNTNRHWVKARRRL